MNKRIQQAKEDAKKRLQYIDIQLKERSTVIGLLKAIYKDITS